MPANRVLVDLDSFLDANAALCRRFDAAGFADYVRNGKYRERYSNEFWKVSSLCTKEDFLSAWEKRGTELLRESIHTNIHVLIGGVLSSIEWGPHLGDPTNSIEMTVNLAPYTLSDQETATLVAIIETALPMVDTVKTVSWPLWALHPQQIKGHFDLVVMSNFIPWFKLFVERIDEFELGNIDVIAPRLFHETPERGTDDWTALEEEDIFTFLSGRLYGRCMLTFESPYWFSMVDPGDPTPPKPITKEPVKVEPETGPTPSADELDDWEPEFHW